MLQWVCMDATKLGFGILIGRLGCGLDRRHAFVTMRCERSDKYKESFRKLKCDNTITEKYECHLKLCIYHKLKDTCTFSMIYCIHNYGLRHKLVDNHIICHLNSEEKKLVSNMTLNMVEPKNILTVAHLKIQPNALRVLVEFQNHHILFEFYLKPECLIPQTISYHRHPLNGHVMPQKRLKLDWITFFFEYDGEFTKLNNIEREPNHENYKAEPLIDLDGDTFF